MLLDLLQYPVLNTKKVSCLINKNQYTFEIDKKLSKPQIKKLIEEFFKIKVLAINTHRLPQKFKRFRSSSRSFRKRVIITVSSNINLIN